MSILHKAFYLLLSIILFQASLFAYPLDGYDETEISRLDGYFHSLLTDSGLQNLTAGALLSITELKLKKPAIKSVPVREDLSLKSQILNIMPSGNVSLSLLNISDPANPQYVGINDNQQFIPGSIGKIMVATSLFDALAKIAPRSTEAREKILRERIITANEFIEKDEHVVPFWDETSRKIYFRPLQIGDQANLWTFLDWMLSASSNAAASMVMREVLLMNHFRKNYPPTQAEEMRFFASSVPQSILASSFSRPMSALGFAPSRLFQASFFTARAKSLISGAGSSANTRDLVSLLLKIENGTLVDEFSSLEMKRLLYLTQHRERYVGVSVLNDAAVYFKAGSLYKCGGSCEKYEGTKLNMLNAAVIVEDPVGKDRVHYLLALSTNIVRRNSEQIHKSIAANIHRIILSNMKKRL